MYFNVLKSISVDTGQVWDHRIIHENRLLISEKDRTTRNCLDGFSNCTPGGISLLRRFNPPSHPPRPLLHRPLKNTKKARDSNHLTEMGRKRASPRPEHLNHLCNRRVGNAKRVIASCDKGWQNDSTIATWKSMENYRAHHYRGRTTTATGG